MKWRVQVTRGALLLMESLWTYAIVAFLVAAITEGGKPSLLGVCAVVFLSYGISRFLQDSNLSLGLIRIWGTIFSFIVFYTIVRIDFFGDWQVWNFSWANDLFNHTGESVDKSVGGFFGIPMLWCFWVRGLLRGQDRLGFEDVLSSFGIGVLVIAFVEVFQGATDGSPAAIGHVPVPYVAIGLIAIGLSHAARAEEEANRAFGSVWLVVVGALIGVLAGVALVVAVFDLGATTDTVRDAGSEVAEFLEPVGEAVLYPVEKVSDLMFRGLSWLFRLVLGTPNPPAATGEAGEAVTCIDAQMDNGLSEEAARAECEQGRRELPEWAKTLVRILVAAPLVGILILATVLVFKRFRKRIVPASLKESTYQEGRLASDLGGLLGNLLNRLRPNLRLGRDHLDATRRLYFDMLDDAEHKGIARLPGQTPLELSPTLAASYQADVPRTITDAFDEARYAGRPKDDAEVRRLRQEWESVRSGEPPS